MLEEAGFVDVRIGEAVDTFSGATGEEKARAFDEIFRVLRPGGVLQFADIANGRPVPVEAMRDVDLWTG